MNANIVKINFDTIDGSHIDEELTIAIDREQTAAIFMHGIIAGAVKAFYNQNACNSIAKFLAVVSGLKKRGVKIDGGEIKYIYVANKIFIGVTKLFDGYKNHDFEVKLCCRYIIDELAIAASDTAYTDIEDLEMD